MAGKYHRLSQILQKLYKGEKIKISSLAKEFNTSTKTIQRDLKEKLRSDFLIREGHSFWLKTSKKEQKDAFVSDVLKNLAHSLGGEFEKDAYKLLDKLCSLTPQITPIFHRSQELLKIQKAISNQNILLLTYRGLCLQVQPLNLCFVRKALFLSAIHLGEQRLFAFEEISDCKITRQRFQKQNPPQTLEFVSLFVYPKVANYARTLQWGENQTILEDNEQNLIIEFFCPNQEALIQEVLSQIPHIIILEPQSLKEEVEKRILTFAKKCQI